MKLRYPIIAFCAVASIFFASCGSTKVEDASDSAKNETEKSEELSSDDKASSEDFSDANKELLEKVEKARTAAINAGAQSYYRALFDETESKYMDSKAKIEKTPNINYSDDLNDLIKRYQSMEKATLAKKLQEKANSMNSSDLDSLILKTGLEALEKYDSLKDSGSGADLLAQAELAYNSYFGLVNKGFIAMAGRERKAALSAKKDAESVKAQIAKKTKDAYNKAAETFKKADSSFAAKNIESAYDGYKSSKESWTEMFEIVKKDREEAEARIAAAKQKVLEAEQVATAADTEAPLTEKVSGIEDENAKLLEEDNFAKPEDSINDVESSDIAQTAEKIADAAIAAEEATNNASDKISNTGSEAVKKATKDLVKEIEAK